MESLSEATGSKDFDFRSHRRDDILSSILQGVGEAQEVHAEVMAHHERQLTYDDAVKDLEEKHDAELARLREAQTEEQDRLRKKHTDDEQNAIDETAAAACFRESR